MSSLDRVVMKFGGTSVKDAEMIKKVASITHEKYSGGVEVVVVVSAMSGTTDQLLEIGENLKKGKKQKANQLIDEIETRHKNTINQVISDKKLLGEVLGEVGEVFGELRLLADEMDNFIDRSFDYLMSFGERLSAPIVSAAIQDIGVPSTHLTGREAGVITNQCYGSAIPLSESNKRIKESVLPLLNESVPVITGFIGCSKNGDITTLGRGGSDYSASTIGRAIDADEIWIWTDVDGLLTTDPSVVPDAKTLKRISYREAMELSFFGAEVLHPKSIEPAIEKNIPVRVKNTYKPSFKGTLIVKDEEKVEGVVKGVSAERDVALVNITGMDIIGTPGIAADAFGALANADINIIMISTGSSEPTISLLVDEKDLSRATKALKTEFSDNTIEEITSDPEVSVITVVGSGMAGTPGIAGRVFTAIGRKKINIIMISQGSSEFNISFVIKNNQTKKALTQLHKEFGLHNINY
ncbi:aspartate kinase [Methanonatronarchaeum sp. AMET-Sl]|uniref:aspartate kinase n=1 Tax=Methanonatronarchaeum sp. AMET-Sl TaxID=3037654 RepID=UPI00244D9C77|nr:aspartate kinase [Methanonatronarchaeum sp. AMET-Sl]WGI17632.1 aspartate kinase [Methanonatronarchaeum sp. AMET-Sl]